MKIKDLIDSAYDAFEQSDYHKLARIKDAFVSIPVLQSFNFRCSAFLYMSIELQDLSFKPPLFLQVIMKVKNFETHKEGIIYFEKSGSFSVHQSGKEKLINNESIYNWLDLEVNNFPE